MLTQDEAIEKLQRQLNRINDIKVKARFSPDFKKWRRDTEVAITRIFGEGTRHLKDFNDINYIVMTLGNTPEAYENQRFREGLDNAASILSSLIDEVKEYWDDEPILPARDHTLLIEHICNRFHLVARQLRSRYNDRETLNIEDEYDVQDLFHALLTLEFDDIRPEEWTPSYAGSGSRVDFLLKQEQIVVEAKKTRKGLGAKQIGEQLIIDIQRYQSHPDCRTLICFVYDPEGRIANPRGIENDLNGQKNGLDVKAIIAPKGL